MMRKEEDWCQTMSDEPVIHIGDGWSAERRNSGRYAIFHRDGGLHMAGYAERVMVMEIIRLLAEVDRSREVLRELVATVRGECPQLLDEDRGGNARLSIAIDNLLREAKR